MINVTFVRHGQTEWNKEHRIQGIKDIPLNETGRREAKELMNSIENEYDYLITSPLKRASETAEIINNKINLPLEKDGLLVERDFKTLAGQKASFVKVMEDADAVIETRESVLERIYNFLSSILKRGKGEYLVITHGGVISFLLNDLSGGEITWMNTPISNCSLTRIKFTDRWEIDYINEIRRKICQNL